MIPYLFEYRYPKCFLCGDTVLQLAGQDIHLPWNALEDNDLELHKIFGLGHAHLSCLLESEWGELIARRKLDSLKPYRKVVFSNDNISMLTIPPNSISIIRNDGWFLQFPLNSSTHKIDKGRFVSISTIYDIHLDWPIPMPGLYSKFNTNKKLVYPLMDFIDAFNVHSRLMDVKSVINGTLQYQSQWALDENGTKQLVPFEKGSFQVKGNYFAYIPEDVWRLIPTNLIMK